MLKKYRAIEFGDFTLASGAKSTFYIDVKSAVTDPDLLLSHCARDRPLPHIRCRGRCCGRRDPPRRGNVYGRTKTLRNHTGRGKESWEKGGHHRHGEKDRDVLLVEDVTTSGGLALYGINALRAAGARQTGLSRSWTGSRVPHSCWKSRGSVSSPLSGWANCSPGKEPEQGIFIPSVH